MEKQNRLLWLDSLRGLAVILMLEQHLGIWFWKLIRLPAAVFNHPILIAFNGLGGIAAPLFSLIAGIGAVFLYRKKQQDKSFLMRGGLLLLFGYILNFLVPSWFTMGSWYILHLIGFSLILYPIFRRLPNWSLIVVVVFSVFFAAILQYFIHTPNHLNNMRMGNWHLSGSFFRLMFVEGHFPMFPWIAFFFSGVLSGRWLLSGELKNILKFAMSLFILSLVLVAVSLLHIPFLSSGIWRRFFLLTPTFYPPLPSLIFGLISVALFIFLIFSSVEFFGKGIFANFLVRFGRGSLSILIVHIVIFKEIFIRIGLWQSFSTGLTLLFLFSVIISFSILLFFWEKINYKYGAEYIIRKFDFF